MNNKNEVLEKDEELLLIKKIQNGDNEALEKFITYNMNLVKSIANQMNTTKMSFEDLVQEGYLGLIRAIELFDENKKCRFSTYATRWIYSKMMRALENNGNTIRIPSYMINQVTQLKKTKEILRLQLYREPTIYEIAQEMHLPLEKVENMMLLFNISSLDDLIDSDSSEDTLGSVYAASSYNLEDDIVSRELTIELYSLLEECNLSELEKNVLSLRYGLYDGKDYTLKEVAQMYGVCDEKIRRIEISAIRKLIKNKKMDDLAAYLDCPERNVKNLQYLREQYEKNENNYKSVKSLLKKRLIN